MLNDNLFGQTYNQIQKAVFGETAQNFQMIVAPIAFTFQTAGLGQMDPATYQLVSQMPVWSPVATFGQNGTTLFSAYRQLLANVTFKVDDSKAKDLAQQASQINGLQRQLSEEQANTTQAYNVAKANGGDVFIAMYPTIKDWLGGPGSTYVTKINTLTKSINELSDKYANDLASMQGDSSLSESLKATQIPTEAPASGTNRRGWILVADSGGKLQWQPEFVVTKTPDQVRQDLAGGSVGGFKVNLDGSSNQGSEVHSFADAKAGYESLFFSIGGEGGWDKLDINNDEKNVHVEISVESSMTNVVTPGVWFNGGFLKNLAQNRAGAGYQLVNGWSVTGKSNAAFGENGLLSTMVAALVLVTKPSVTVSLSEAAFKRNYEKIKASGGLRIGPFTFGGKGGHESDYTLTTNGSTSFTASSTSSDPLIIGIAVGFPGIGSPST
jgi:hypothetical protein